MLNENAGAADAAPNDVPKPVPKPVKAVGAENQTNKKLFHHFSKNNEIVSLPLVVAVNPVEVGAPKPPNVFPPSPKPVDCVGCAPNPLNAGAADEVAVFAPNPNALCVVAVAVVFKPPNAGADVAAGAPNAITNINELNRSF